MAKGLELATLKALPLSFCPDGTLVDSLASEAAALTRNSGVARPFVHVDLRKWLPFWAVTETDAGSMILRLTFALCMSCCLCIQIRVETSQSLGKWLS